MLGGGKAQLESEWECRAQSVTHIGGWETENVNAFPAPDSPEEPTCVFLPKVASLLLLFRILSPSNNTVCVDC